MAFVNRLKKWTFMTLIFFWRASPTSDYAAVVAKKSEHKEQ